MLILAQMGVWGASGRRSLPCSQASQCGLVVRPAKGFGSRLCLRRGGVGGGGVGPAVVASLNHAHWSMTYSQTSTISVSW
jgi:hypothetical protein